MQRLLRGRKFRIIVTLVVLLTFLNLSLPLNLLASQRAYAAEKDLGGAGVPGTGLLDSVLNSVKTFIANVGESLKAITNLGTSIKNLFAPGSSTTHAKGNGAESASGVPKKTLYSKTKDQGNGKYTTEIYSEPIHYKNKNGELEEIKNNLTPTGEQGFAFENEANSFKVYFAENTVSDNLVRVKDDKHLLEWKLLDARKVRAEKADNYVTYKSLFENVDLKYTVQNTKVKEEFVLQDKSVATDYRFELNVRDLYYVQESDGSITFYDQLSKEKVWSIEKPFMYDASGSTSDSVNASIKNQNGKIYLTLSADKDWLKSKDRKFPVVLDPTIQPGAADGRDTFISSSSRNLRPYAWFDLRVGNDPSYGATTSFIKFEAVNTQIPHRSNVFVDSAFVQVNQYSGGSGGNIDLHQVYNDWTSSALTYNGWLSACTQRNNWPGYNTNPESSAYSHNGALVFDITNLAQRWVWNQASNYGVALTYGGSVRKIYSSDSGNNPRPKITINFSEDWNPPELYITDPSYGEIVNGIVPIQTWTRDDVSGVNRVEYFVDGRYIGTAYVGTKDPAYQSVDWNTWEFGTGDHTIYARAFDNIGRMSEAWSNVKVDNAGPQVSITSPSSGAVMSGSIPINISANDWPSGVSHVDLYINDSYVTRLYGPNYTYIWNTGANDVGVNTIEALAYDNLDNYTWSAPITVKVDNDNPEVQIVDPTAGDCVRNIVPVKFSTGDDFGIVQTRFYVDETLKETKNYPYDSNPNLWDDMFSLDTTKLTDGAHALKITVRDAYGRESSTALSVLVDNSNPTGNIEYPANGQIVKGTVPIEATADDSISAVDKVEFYVDDVLAKTATDTPYVYEWDTTGATDGAHTAVIKIYDRAGNVISKQVGVIVDNTKPIPFISSPANGDTVKGIVPVSAAATDNHELSKMHLKIEKLGGGYEADFETDTAGSIIKNNWQGVWLWDTTKVRDGQYSLTLESLDAAGNSNTAKIDVSVKNIPDALGVKGFWSYHNQQMPYFSSWVNSRNGNLTLKRTDLDVPGRGLPVTLSRVYNSQAKAIGALGWGWHLNAGTYISEYGNGNVEILDATGTKLHFTKNSDGTYTAPAGIYDTLAKNVDGSYTLTYQSKTKDIFDSAGNLVKTVNLAGNSIAYDYDANGRLEAIIDDSGRAYTLGYNAAGFLETVTDPANQKITYGYDENNNLAQLTDQAGNVSTYTYDENHNLISFTDGTKDASGAQNVSKLEYTGGKVVAFIDPLGNKTTYTYDTANKQMTVTDALGHKTIYTYNEKGNPVSVTDPVGATTSYEFDSNNNLMATIDANNKKTSYVYDSFGNVVSTMDTMGRITQYAYDVNNKPISTTYPDSTSAQNTYDEKGQLIKEIDALGKVTSYTYDEFGNRTSTVNAKEETTTYTYDGLGNMTSVTDPKGSTTIYGYDALSRVTAVVDPLGNTTSYNYDALGNRTTVTDANGATVKYEYNALGQVVAQTDALGATTKMTYDGNGNLTAATDAKGGASSFAYDAAGNKIAETDALGNTTTMKYDPAGNVVATNDPEGRETTLAYDALGQVESITTPEGAKTAMNYDSEGNVTNVTDPNGGTTNYAYDTNGQVTEAKDPLGYIAKWEYDANGNVAKEIDANGQSTSMAYDALGNVTTVTDAAGSSAIYAYDVSGNITSITDSSGEKTEYTYDEAGRVTAEKDPLGNTTKYDMDGVGNLVALTDAEGNEATYDYDKNGRLTKETDPYSNATSFAYDTLGNLTKETDPEGNTTKYEYDANGRLTKETDGEGFVEKYTYTPSGAVASATDANGETSKYTYDSQGNVTSETDPLGNTEKYAYDGMGSLTKETDSLGNTTAYKHDLAGNLIEEANPLGYITKYTYDAKGEITSETDPMGGTTRYEYGAQGEIAKEIDELGNATSYAYDPQGNVTKETDPLGKTISREYDKAGNLVAETDAQGNTTRYSYDANGNIKQEIDPQGNVTTFNFDANDNMTGVVDALGNATTYSYDANGNITKATDAEGLATAYSYDANDNLTSVTDPAGSTTKYTYDGEENLASMTDPSGQVTTYTYTVNDKLASVIDPAGNTTTYTYDANNNMTSMTNANGATTTYAYDNAGELTRIAYPNGSTVSYAYSAAGDMVSKTDASGTTNYSYDAEGKLTSTTSSDGTTVEYTYDAAGNVTAKKVNGSNSNYTYDGDGHITSITDAAGTTITFTYDKRGNRTSITYPNGTTTSMEYDKANRLTKIATVNAAGTVLSTATYTYDKLGNRVEITTAAGMQKFAYDRGGQLVEASYPDGRTVKYAYDKRGNKLSLEVTVAFNGVAPNGEKKGIEQIITDITTGGQVNGNKEGLRETIQAVLLGLDTQGNKNGLKETILASTNGYTISIATYEYNEANQLEKAEY